MPAIRHASQIRVETSAVSFAQKPSRIAVAGWGRAVGSALRQQRATPTECGLSLALSRSAVRVWSAPTSPLRAQSPWRARPHAERGHQQRSLRYDAWPRGRAPFLRRWGFTGPNPRHPHVKMRGESGGDSLQHRRGRGLRVAHREAECRDGKDACALSTPACLRAKMRKGVAAHLCDLEARYERAQFGGCMEARGQGDRAGSQGDGAGAHTGLGATIQLDMRGRWCEARAAPAGANPHGAERKAGRCRRGRGSLANHAHGTETGGARSNPTPTVCRDAGSPDPILAPSVHSYAEGRNNSDSCNSDPSVEETLLPLFASVSLSTHVFSQARPRLQGETSFREARHTFVSGDTRWRSECERRAPAFSPTTGACGLDRTGLDVRVQPPRRPTSSVCTIPSATTSPTSTFSGLTGSTLFSECRKQAEVRPSGHLRGGSWTELNLVPEVRIGHFRGGSWAELNWTSEVHTRTLQLRLRFVGGAGRSIRLCVTVATVKISQRRDRRDTWTL